MHADPDFLAFVESLSAQPEALPSGDAVGSSGQKDGQDSGPQVTALMAYLQEKHSLKKKPPAIMVRPRTGFISCRSGVFELSYAVMPSVHPPEVKKLLFLIMIIAPVVVMMHLLW